MRSRIIAFGVGYRARQALRTQLFTRVASTRWSSSNTDTRRWSTPLAKQLHEAITATGPIPVASFMRMCLTSDMGGYYTSKPEGRDQFGQRGDFMTSPEISQIFGELIGVWFVAEWMAQGKKGAGVELIEIGPGRGTLMDDMLRTIRNFKAMASSIEAVYMVEASPSLREAQKQLLCGDAPMTETATGHKSISKYAGIPIIWTENIRFVPDEPDKSPFIVAHEFFDALPIHIFESIAASAPVSADGGTDAAADASADAKQDTIHTPTGEHILAPEISKSKKTRGPEWREMVVSPTPPGSTHLTLRTPKSQQSSNDPPEFQLTRARAATPHSLYLPEISPRYKALKSQPGSVIEVSPESHVYVQEFAKRIGGTADAPKQPSGAALILDYGPSETIPTNSLRGIRGHQRVSPLSAPGLVDVSADVDFDGLADSALAASPRIEVHGPVEQASFLLTMGIKERAEMLLKKSTQTDKHTRIDGAWRRLIDRGGSGMGKVYKAMAILPESGGKRRPVGFGGDI